MNDANKKKAINSLSRLNYIRNAVNTLPNEIRALKNELYDIKASQTDKIIVSGGAGVSADDRVLYILQEIEKLENSYNRALSELRTTESALNALTEEDRELLRIRYFDHLKGWEEYLMETMNIERATLYRKLKTALRRYCVARFGSE